MTALRTCKTCNHADDPALTACRNCWAPECILWAPMAPDAPKRGDDFVPEFDQAYAAALDLAPIERP